MRLALACLAALLAAQASAADIKSARYTDPTTRYPHGVLGDDIEYAGLEVTLTNGQRRAVTWQPGMVFEDIAPRVVDVTGDGRPEVITVESSDTQGARLSVWGLDAQDALVPLASSPHIGRRFRWLAPIGVADIDGDGLIEIAWIDRPHLAKTLNIWRVSQDADGQTSLTEVATLQGLTNHRIGEDFISGGIRTCDNSPEMIVADATWTRIIGVKLKANGLITRDLGAFSTQAITKALTCP